MVLTISSLFLPVCAATMRPSGFADVEPHCNAALQT